MSHIRPLNLKARRLCAMLAAKHRDALALTQDPPPTEYPFGCTTNFAPGWEVDSAGGTNGLCQPIERDLYDCYHTCYWPAQVPDGVTNNPTWTNSCGAPMNDWKSLDLVFP
jgi:Quinohemoprotein amine dehydrogenase, gamma subunit